MAKNADKTSPRRGAIIADGPGTPTRYRCRVPGDPRPLAALDAAVQPAEDGAPDRGDRGRVPPARAVDRARWGEVRALGSRPLRPERKAMGADAGGHLHEERLGELV